MPVSRTLMIQGTTSDAGKTTLVAALCRLLARQGVRVAPFKPQNMALNSAVTVDGGEIGRSQALQAYAAGIAPHTDMNPVLLKPSSDRASQVIIHGKARSDMDARAYHRFKPEAMLAVLDSYRRLSSQYDAVLVEGAGSPAEINLREGDIANMGFAEAVDCPVLLVADIDRGGVFAHLVGTVEVLAPSERARIVGFVINRFRGDPALLESGIRWLEARTGKPVLAVLPFLSGLFLDAEDALPANPLAHAAQSLRIVAPAFPRISNATDMDALRLNASVAFDFVRAGQPVPPSDLIVLPGSKNVRADLAWLRQHGWEDAIKRHLRYGGKVIGICGGLQMLGRQVHDPLGLEGPSGSSPGLGLLDFDTTLSREKQLRNVSGFLTVPSPPLGALVPHGRSKVASARDRVAVAGYEIHMGVSVGPGLGLPAVMLNGNNGQETPEGAVSADGQIFATYLHGLFDLPASASALLHWAVPGHKAASRATDLAARRSAELERLTNAVEQAFDLTRLAAWLPLTPDSANQADADAANDVATGKLVGDHV